MSWEAKLIGREKHWKDRKHINYKRLREDKEQCLQDVPGEGKIDNPFLFQDPLCQDVREKLTRDPRIIEEMEEEIVEEIQIFYGSIWIGIENES